MSVGFNVKSNAVVSSARTPPTSRLRSVWLGLKPVLAPISQRLGLTTAAGTAETDRDLLTGLLNRQAFEARLQAAAVRPSRVGQAITVLALDLDNFGLVNDSAGYRVGNCLLRAVGERLQQAVEAVASHGAVARVGGDEFVVLVEAASPVAQLAQVVLGSFEQPFQVGLHMFYLTASLGAVCSPQSASNPQARSHAYLEYADIALHQAKQQGKGSFVCFTAEMQVAAVKRLQLETELRAALKQKQLEVYYQPIVNAETLALEGFEALLRWHHPTRGLLLPNSFIAIAEQSGLIVEIDWWVMAQACAQMQQWQRRFPAARFLTVSVNCSNQQFLQPDCVQRLQQILHDSQLPPSSLTVEITERTFMADEEAVERVLDWIVQQQIGLSLDDFGTGYSSLGYLCRFPVSTLKIDRSFVQASALNYSSSVVVEAIIALGHKLGLAIVAEGVETSRAVDWLRQRGCDQLQGFLFSQALTAAAAADLIAAKARQTDRGVEWPALIGLDKQPG